MFMLKNFEEIRHSPTFLKMSFKEVKKLIKSQDLVVNKEDEVLDSVIEWVEFMPKNQINLFENDNHNLTNSDDDFKTESIPELVKTN